MCLCVSLKEWERFPTSQTQVPLSVAVTLWKYPLKHWERSEGSPLKDSKLGALIICKNSGSIFSTLNPSAHNIWLTCMQWQSSSRLQHFFFSADSLARCILSTNHMVNVPFSYTAAPTMHWVPTGCSGVWDVLLRGVFRKEKKLLRTTTTSKLTIDTSSVCVCFFVTA